MPCVPPCSETNTSCLHAVMFQAVFQVTALVSISVAAKRYSTDTGID